LCRTVPTSIVGIILDNKSSPAAAVGSPRNTTQRRAILAALDQAAGFVSAQELYARIAAGGDRVALATVYAQLKKLTANGDVDAVMNERGESLFRRCAAETHHHHLACRVCGTTLEIEIPPLEGWTRTIAAEHGFYDVHHVLELTGVCRACHDAPR
jgi:Fur family ferric uptake transcriptional regulator